MNAPAASLAMFEEHRRRLFGIGYGMLGQVMDAEDLVQDVYLRWVAVDAAAVENPAAYLTNMTTRLAIDRLRSARHRRETYVGPWLPEPLQTEPDPGDTVAEAERLSLAFLTALERLNPVERAVLLLRDVLDFDYGEIAPIVDRTPANCRQIAGRARDRVGDANRSQRPSAEREQRLVTTFVAAMAAGDVEQLRSVLVADIALWSDGGGKATAARHPIHGADRVSRFLVGIRKSGRAGDMMGFTTVNGHPAIYLERDEMPFAVIAIEATDEGIIAVRSVLNPDKLAHLAGAIEAPFPVVLT